MSKSISFFSKDLNKNLFKCDCDISTSEMTNNGNHLRYHGTLSPTKDLTFIHLKMAIVIVVVIVAVVLFVKIKNPIPGFISLGVAGLVLFDLRQDWKAGKQYNDIKPAPVAQ